MDTVHLSKKCPYCSTSLPHDATLCFSCKRKVGPSNRHGVAQKPFDWVGYGSAIFAIGAFGVFLWFAFFKN